MNTNFTQSPIMTKSFLTVDNTILSIAKDITKEINLKYANKEVSLEDVLIMIESVKRAVPVAVKKGTSVKEPYLGSFCIKPDRFRYLPKDVVDSVNNVRSMSNDEALLAVLEESMY